MTLALRVAGGSVRQIRRFSATRLILAWPPQPIDVPHAAIAALATAAAAPAGGQPSGSSAHERLGKAALETTLIPRLLHVPARARGELIDALTGPGALQLLGLTLPHDVQLLAYIGLAVEHAGFNTTSSWIADLYAPFLSKSRIASTSSATQAPLEFATAPAPSPLVPSAENITKLGAAGIAFRPEPASGSRSAPESGNPGPSAAPAAASAAGVDTFVGPIDFGDGMNLFDSETWLAESPIAQKLWKEGNP